MTRKPPNFQWLGFTDEQRDLLERLDFYGNNGWARTSQLDFAMPILLRECGEAGLTLPQIRGALGAIGYDSHALHQLDRWESKRSTGKFGR